MSYALPTLSLIFETILPYKSGFLWHFSNFHKIMILFLLTHIRNLHFWRTRTLADDRNIRALMSVLLCPCLDVGVSVPACLCPRLRVHVHVRPRAQCLVFAPGVHVRVSSCPCIHMRVLMSVCPRPSVHVRLHVLVPVSGPGTCANGPVSVCPMSVGGVLLARFFFFENLI